MTKRIISILMILSTLVSLCACSKIGSLFSKNTEQSFSYPLAQMPKTLDPQIASDEAELIIIENCMEGLVRINARGEIIPAVAESWTVSDDGLHYTFRLNRNARWNADVEDEDFELKGFNPQITAHDFVFAVSRAVMKDTDAPDFQSVSLIKNAHKINASGKSDTSSLGIKATDDFTLEITLESANADFLISLASAVFMPCSEQFFEYCAGRYGRQAKYFLSNAGLELTAWNENSVVMRKSETYALANTSKADSVTLYKDANAFESFKNNNYDALAVSDDHIDEALADTSLSVQSYDDTIWSLVLRCDGQLTGIKQYRQALLACIDHTKLTAPEWASEAQGIVPNICTAGGSKYRESTGRAGIPTYAPEKAVQKYLNITEKYLEKEDSNELPSLRFICTAAFNTCAKQIVQDWQMHFGTGFEVKIEALGLEELKQALESGEYDIAIMPVSADTLDTLVFLKKFSAENVLAYQSDAYNKFLNSTKSEAEKSVICENALLSDAALYPLYSANSYYVQRNTIRGIYFYAFGGKVNFLNAERIG